MHSTVLVKCSVGVHNITLTKHELAEDALYIIYLFNGREIHSAVFKQKNYPGLLYF